jgi:hypothetical protein
MSPTQILDAMAEAYASCVYYRDTGSVVNRFVFQDSEKNKGSTTTFKTAFVRPDRFRFEFTAEAMGGGRYVVWSRGQRAWTWFDGDPGVEEHESLGLALAGATGISGGSAHTVPALLSPEQVSGRGLADGAAEVASLADEMRGGVTCYRLAIRWKEDPAKQKKFRESYHKEYGEPPLERWVRGPRVVWIDRGSFLLRRIEECTQYETFRTETVTTYDPAFGVPIGEDELNFDPPGC